jgi:hypothetical protein
MKILAAVLISLFLGESGLAQSRASPPQSVWMDDHSAEGVKAAVAAGKTTLIYSGGSSLAVANHVQVARYVAQRVAEELTNALVLPIIPSAPGTAANRPGTTGPADAYGVLNRAITSNGFRNVMVIADEDTGAGDTTLENLANRLDADWKSKGVRVYYVTAHEMRPGQEMTFNSDYLRRWAGRTVPAGRRKSVEDFAELLFVDRDHKWLRQDMIPLEDRAVVSPELGRILVEERVSSILNHIRALSPSHVR